MPSSHPLPAAAQAARASLRGARLRTTLHRLAVLEVFMAEPARRFTADAVAERLLLQGNWIAMPTIYNTMRLLIEQDLVDRSDADGGRGVFWLKQGDGRTLHQVMCRSCKCSFAPHDAALARLIGRLCAQHGLSLGEPSVLVQIRCGSCQARSQPQGSRAVAGNTLAHPRDLDGDQAASLLRRTALRGTRGQIAVLRFFLETLDVRHSADAVARQLRERHSGMALSTLYRAINALVDARIVEKAWSEGRHVFWIGAGADARPHRIVCRSCHRGLSTGDPELGRVLAELCERFGVELPRQPLHIQIRCQACVEENRPTANTLFGPLLGPFAAKPNPHASHR